jgi:hypothetical protein
MQDASQQQQDIFNENTSKADNLRRGLEDASHMSESAALAVVAYS